MPQNRPQALAVPARQPVSAHLIPDGNAAVWSAVAGRLAPRATAIAWTIFGLYAVLSVLTRFTYGTSVMDEGFLLTYPWLMNHGMLPYRDFWSGYPPGEYTVLALLYHAVGESQWVERAAGSAVIVATTLLANRMLTGSWSRFSLIGAPTAAGLLFWSGIEPSGIVLCIPCLLAGLWFTRRPPLAVVCFLLGATFRWEAGVVGLVALGAYASLLSIQARKLCLRPFLTGCVLLFVLLAAGALFLQWITGGQALGQFVVFQLTNGQAGRTLPLFPPIYYAWLLPAAIPVLMGPPIMALAAWFRGSSFLAATNLALIPNVLDFVHRADTPHLAFVAAVAVPWLLYSLLNLPPPRSIHDASTTLDVPPRLSRRGRFATAAVLLMGLCIGAATFVQVINNDVMTLEAVHGMPYVVRDGPRTMVPSSGVEARDTQIIATFLRRHAPPAEPIFVGLTDSRHSMFSPTVLYYLLGHAPCGRYLEYEPGLEDTAPIQRQIIASLAHCPWVVLRKGAFWYEPNSSQRIGSNLLNLYLRRHYRTVVDTATYQVCRRCSGTRGCGDR